MRPLCRRSTAAETAAARTCSLRLERWKRHEDGPPYGPSGCTVSSVRTSPANEGPAKTATMQARGSGYGVMSKSPSTYLIGRSAQADIVLGDATVSRLHAELVSGRDRTWYLTDRNSTGGTFRWDAGTWNTLTQDFIHPGDRLRFGTFECSADDLLRQVPLQGGAADGPPAGGSGSGPAIRDNRPQGPVRRDPMTGDVVSIEDE